MAKTCSYDPRPWYRRLTAVGGTEGDPITFDDLVAADRAGTLKLLDGVIDADPDTFSLDYQVQSVELRALYLSIICTPRAGATVDIAGKDAWGNAISENGIDISSGSATTTNRFSEVDANGITVNGLQVDDEFDVEQDQWGVIWDYSVDETYIMDCAIYLGDNTTPTYFKDIRKIIVFSERTPEGTPANLFYTLNNVTFQLGELKAGGLHETVNGCVIHTTSSSETSIFNPSYTSTRYLYGCRFSCYPDQWRKLVINAYDNDRYYNCSFTNGACLRIFGDTDFFNVDLTGFGDYWQCDVAFWYQMAPISPVLNDVKALNFNYAVKTYSSSDCVVKDMHAICRRAVGIWSSSWNDKFELIDCYFSNWDIYYRGSGRVMREHTCNIHVADKSGANLAAVNVKCYDKNNDLVFDVNTNAAGDITEQLILYYEWTNLAAGYKDEDDAIHYSPHKFVLSKTGYETLEIEQITVDAPIDWHLELQDPVVECDYPVEGDVEEGVEYDSGAKIGNFAVPEEAEVKKDIGYGALGIEFIGTLEAGEALLLRGVNLNAMLEKDTNLSAQLERRTNMVGIMREVEAEGG